MKVPGVEDYFTEVLKKPIYDTKNKHGGFLVDFFDDKQSIMNISFANNFADNRNSGGCSGCVWGCFAVIMAIFWLGIMGLVGVSVWQWNDYYNNKMSKLGIAQWWQGWLFWFGLPIVCMMVGAAGCMCLWGSKRGQPVSGKAVELEESIAEDIKGKEFDDNN